METITARRALELLIDVVDTYGPDTVYGKVELHSAWNEEIPGLESEVVKGCRYEYGGAPSCLVGHVLHRSGATLEFLRELDMRGCPASRLAKEIECVDPGAALVLDAVQCYQDNGATWGEALGKAREVYERVEGYRNDDLGH